MIKIRTMTVSAAVLTAALVAGVSSPVWAADSKDVQALKDQVTQLQTKVIELEKKLAAQPGKPVVQAQPAMMGYDPMDPFANMDAMEQQMQALMGGGPGMSAGPMAWGRAASFAPDYDVRATDKAYIISFDMPGMDKAKINVEVKNGMILVSGERSSESKEDSGKVYRQERSFGYFSRSIPLPEDAKPETIAAKYDKGVLTLTIDKKEGMKKAAEQQKIEVK